MLLFANANKSTSLYNIIIELVYSISRDEGDAQLMQYITYTGIPPSCSTADFQSNECITSL